MAVLMSDFPAAGSPGESRSRFAGTPGRPVLIGACPRSGTTLLRTMLHNHPELAMPRETRFVVEAWDRRRMFGDLTEAANREAVARWIFERDASLYRRFGLPDYQLAIARLVESPPTLGSVLAAPFILYAQKHEKPRWGDKRPLYAPRIGVVWDLFPQAQFVNVVRDPRACAASMRKLGWYEGSIVPAVELWQRSIRSVDSWRSKLASDQLLDVRFEDLIGDPEGTLARIARFAGLRDDGDAIEQMLRYHERREIRSDRYHANLSRPPDPELATGWDEVLTPGEIAFVEKATRPAMLRHGYAPEADGVEAPAALLRELRRRQRRVWAARLTLSSKDRIKKLLLHRHPLAAVQLASGLEAVLSPTATDDR